MRERAWENPHDHLESMEHAELRMLRWIINAQVTIGEALVVVIDGQEKIMADLTALQAQLEEVKASAEVASEAVLVALAAASEQLAALKAQIEELTVGAVTQEQIDALTVTAADADAIVDGITAAVTPAV